ncbi:MAG: ornithine carbamoyltransferase [Cytophagales bacterium]|nr:ornithine carbamoyltransferase [Rhizobacter sp.]
MRLISITDLSASDIRSIWASATAPVTRKEGTVAWSFEGNGVRTRTTFIQAFRDLGLACTELPNLLKSTERVCDLAGYLDPFYDLYVVRESNHTRLQEFALASRRPVVNAMSSAGHPCEVLADAFAVESLLGPLQQLQIGLWGPPTNVLRSWHDLASVLRFTVHHFCPTEFHAQHDQVRFSALPDTRLDLLVTDGWPQDFSNPAWSLTTEHMARLGQPRLLPTPPFSIGKELGFDPVPTRHFLGYEQKRALLSVQRAILTHLRG